MLEFFRNLYLWIFSIVIKQGIKKSLNGYIELVCYSVGKLVRCDKGWDMEVEDFSGVNFYCHRTADIES